MIKRILLVFLSFLVISGCSKDEKVEKLQMNEVEKDVDVTKAVEAKDDEIENEKEEEEKDGVFHHPEGKFTIQLDDRLEGEVVIEVDPNGKTYIYYLDESLLKDKVLIGTIESKPAPSKDSDFDIPHYRLVKVEDGEDHLVSEYTGNIEDPYKDHYQWNKDGDAYLPLEEATKFLKARALVSKSLMDSNFMYGSIIVNQTVPERLDSNKAVGLKLSREYFENLQSWYERLDKAALTGSYGELNNILADVGYELAKKYPELRQTPFPTAEIGYNITKTYEQLMDWSFEYYGISKDVVFLLKVNEVKILSQYVDVIREQLEELEKL